MGMASNEVHVDSLAANPQLIEQVGLLRWREWAYGEKDPTRLIDVSRDEAGDGMHLPMTLVAVDAAGGVVGVVGLGDTDDEISDAERAGRAPWILGMVVTRDARRLGIGRLLLLRLQQVAAGLGHSQTWVATGDEAVGFYRQCGWEPVERLRLASTGIATTILAKATHAGTSGALMLDAPAATEPLYGPVMTETAEPPMSPPELRQRVARFMSRADEILSTRLPRRCRAST